MSELVQRALLYKMAIVIGALFCINTMASVIVAAFLHTDWSALTSTEKFVLVWVIVQNTTGTLLAFANKTAARLEAGKFPIETGDTGHFQKPPTA